MLYLLDVAIWPMVLGFGLIFLFTLGMIIISILYAIRLIRRNRDHKPDQVASDAPGNTEENH